MREKGLVHGGKVVWPEEVLQFIRSAYPDEKQGKYDSQHKTGQMTLDDFCAIDWPQCLHD